MTPVIELAKSVTFQPDGSGIDAAQPVFHLEVLLASTGNTQRYPRTHVPQNLRNALNQGGMAELHIVTVDVNSLCSYLLPGRPLHVLTGVRPLPGERLAGLPAVIQRWRRAGFASMMGAVAIGAGLALLGWVLCGLALAIGGAYFIRTFTDLPGRSFWGHEESD